MEDSHELYTHRGVCYRCAEAQFNAMLTKDRQTSTAWAKALLANPDLALLDFETTDLYDADIVQIGVLSARGEMLLETLVKPTKPISPGATAVHGITAEDVKNAPTFEAVEETLFALLEDKVVAVYNLAFDRSVLAGELRRLYEARQDPSRVSTPSPQRDAQQTFVERWLSSMRWEDVMAPYAAFVGEWHPCFEDYRWQPLGGGHQALGDCFACLEVLNAMAAGEG